MTLKLGSTGAAVSQLEQRLKDLGLYTGTIDGNFGGGVQAAVRKFQANKGLDVDGSVGPNTWKALFPDEPHPVNHLLTAPITERCLALTTTFETSTPPPDCFSGLTGDFDGQGISFGALQWNFGQGSLQPLLVKMFTNHPAVSADIFHENLAVLQATLELPIPAQLAWTRTIQSDRFQIFEPWKGMFRALGRTPEFQAIQATEVESTTTAARQLCKRFGVNSNRALALMFGQHR